MINQLSTGAAEIAIARWKFYASEKLIYIVVLHNAAVFLKTPLNSKIMLPQASKYRLF